MFKKIQLLICFQVLISTALFAETKIDSTVTQEIEYTSELFQNVIAKAGEESATLTWSLDHEMYEKLKADGKKLIITYNTKLGDKRHKEGMENSDWMYTKPFDLKETKFEKKPLKIQGPDKIVIKVCCD